MRKFFKSFGYAGKGIALAMRRGNNFKIQILCGTLALIAGVLLGLSRSELAIVILTVAAVLGAEAFNTALEELCDKFAPEHDPHIARIKDLAAAAVLIISIGALGVGVVIFVPHLLN